QRGLPAARLRFRAELAGRLRRLCERHRHGAGRQPDCAHRPGQWRQHGRRCVPRTVRHGVAQHLPGRRHRPAAGTHRRTERPLCLPRQQRQPAGGAGLLLQRLLGRRRGHGGQLCAAPAQCDGTQEPHAGAGQHAGRPDRRQIGCALRQFPRGRLRRADDHELCPLGCRRDRGLRLGHRELRQ
ncbi:hypothetical protein KXX11_003947, partial [Aspergillus fumigatus]